MIETAQPAGDGQATPSLVQTADLGPNGVYLGIKEIPADEVKEGDVLLPDGCDLPPNRYFWAPQLQAFWPIEGSNQ